MIDSRHYKLSYYNIEQEIWWENSNYVLVYNTISNKLRAISKHIWDRVKKTQYSEISEISENILDDMISSSFIVPSSKNELNDLLIENKTFIQDRNDLYIPIQPTASCPFGCGYCGQVHSSKNMSHFTQSILIDRVKQKLETKKYSSIYIGWFGAEPLSGIGAVRNISISLQGLAEQYNIPYAAKIVTNGLLLSDGLSSELIHKHKINFFEITLDGDKEFHDKRRHTKVGGQTFDTIYANLLGLVEAAEGKAHVSIRCNVDPRNKDGIIPLLERLKKDNLHLKTSIYFAPIHSWGNDAHELAAGASDFADWEIDWYVKMKEMGFKQKNYLPTRKKNLCIATSRDDELIDPFGQVFSCTEVSLVPNYEKDGKNIHALGSIFDSSLKKETRREKFSKFYEENKLKEFPCYTCKMLPTCGGGCPKEWAEGHVPCPSIKHNIQQRMLLEFLQRTPGALA